MGTSTSAAQNLLGNSVIDTSGQPLTVPEITNFNAEWTKPEVILSWELNNDGRNRAIYNTLDDSKITFDISVNKVGVDTDASQSFTHSITDSSFNLSINIGTNYTSNIIYNNNRKYE